MIGLAQLCTLLFVHLAVRNLSVYAIKCYHCDNSQSSACGNAFKAYQFQAVTCASEGTQQYKCGKQEQPPDASGWVGVIRACYKLGDLSDQNETNGCHDTYDDTGSLTLTYCFCDTSYCNAASLPVTFPWTAFAVISALARLVCP